MMLVACWASFDVSVSLPHYVLNIATSREYGVSVSFAYNFTKV